MTQPPFPPVGSPGFRAITSPSQSVSDYITSMRTRPHCNLKARADLLRSIVSENEISASFHCHRPDLSPPEFTIKEENKEGVPDWLDMSDDEISVEVPLESCPMIENMQEEAVNEDKDETEAVLLLSIEDIGEQTQADLLDLKAALHQGCSELDVGVIFLEGPTASDRLACIADDLSKLPTNQVTRFLKSFLAADTTRMLQQDLVLIGRHLLFSHMKSFETVPGTLFISCVSDFASRWPQIFTESVIPSSVKCLDRDPVVQTLNRAFKAFGSKESLESLQALMKTLLKLAEQGNAKNAENLKIINTVLGFIEILLNNTGQLQQEILTDLCQLYDAYQVELSGSRIFAKVTLDSVKRVPELSHMKARISDVAASMTHPMKNIIKKVAAAKS